MPVRVQHEDFDVGAELARLRRDRADVGAVASFIGIARDRNDGRDVGALVLEHYPGMTERSIEAIVAQACARWGFLDALVIHRIGRLAPQDQIVLVAVAARHRGEALAACAYIMDYLKTEAPFWKKESGSCGESWVEARDSDEKARARWGG